MGKSYPVIILAGGKIEGKFAKITGQNIKTLIEINGKSFLIQVLTAFRNSKFTERIILVGPEILTDHIPVYMPDNFIPEGKNGIENLYKAIRLLPEKGRVIISSSDLPFIRTADIDEYIDFCPMDSSVNYPVFDKKYIQSEFPELKIRYVRLKDGYYTGGDIFLMDTGILHQYQSLIHQVFESRKSQLKLCRILGFRFIMKFLIHQLTIPELERKIGQLLHAKVKAIINPSARLGIDIDLLDEYYRIQKIAQQLKDD